MTNISKVIPESELVLNQDGSMYHLNLLPEDIADTIITVGDPERVAEVSRYFDRVELRKGKREFITHTGYIGARRITVLSTGIGTDNIDIVLNELDALANIDLRTREVRTEKRVLDIIRIGTSGTLREEIPLNAHLFSEQAIGLEGLMNFYCPEFDEEEKAMQRYVQDILQPEFHFLHPYVVKGSASLASRVAFDMIPGLTATCQGFYAPQGRELRAQTSHHILNRLRKIDHEGKRVTNFEMETAGILGMAKLFGHRACSVSLILANRVNNTFSKEPGEEMEKLIRKVLERL